MDALILSCGTGGGHDAAGRAIAEEFERRGHRAVMIDPYTLKSDKLSSRINGTYILTAQRSPKAFGLVYRIGNFYRKLPWRSPVYFAQKKMAGVLAGYLSENHFDVLIMPHLFPAEIVTNMKDRGMSVPKSIFVATDYVCIPFTEETKCDAYVIPAADLAGDFIKRGIDEEKLYPLGIPTGAAFFSPETKEEAKLRLGLDPNKKYVLVTGGSMGGGSIEKAIDELLLKFGEKENAEFIIICGSNEALYGKLCGRKGVVAIGYTDKMADYMRASDLFITKPGGLSSTEGAVCGVPMIQTAPIPGCEIRNAEYFSSRGMSVAGDLTDEVLSRASELIRSADAHTDMSEKQRKYINPHAAADICDLAEKMVSGK